MEKTVESILKDLAEVVKDDNPTVKGNRISRITVDFGAVEAQMYFDAELPYDADGYKPRPCTTFPWESFVVRDGVRYFKLLTEEEFKKRTYGGDEQ